MADRFRLVWVRFYDQSVLMHVPHKYSDLLPCLRARFEIPPDIDITLYGRFRILHNTRWREFVSQQLVPINPDVYRILDDGQTIWIAISGDRTWVNKSGLVGFPFSTPAQVCAEYDGKQFWAIDNDLDYSDILGTEAWSPR